jgi:peptide chain release factor 1
MDTSALLANIARQFEELGRKLADPAVLRDRDQLRTLGRKHAELSEILNTGRELETVTCALGQARDIIAANEDADLIELARADLAELEPKHQELERQLQELLTPADPDDTRNVIVEIRAGTGGEEAALFAADLYRMYQRHAERRGWKIEIIDANPTNVGGFKEIIFSVGGGRVFGSLKFESGVHRVQRVPQTEASGRIHTSAASVAVLPEAEEIDLEIKPNDLKIDVFRSSGPGGQSVNTTDSAVRITHLPTNTVVTCQDEKSQLKNKTKAMRVLRARLLDNLRREQDDEIASQRRQMVSTGDRSAKIRTYNFPQNRVTDHRIGLTIQNLTGILDGKLDEITAALQEAEQKERFADAVAGSE